MVNSIWFHLALLAIGGLLLGASIVSGEWRLLLIVVPALYFGWRG